MSTHRFETIALHGAYEASENRKTAAVPIYQTSSYVFDDAQYAADLFDLKVAGHIYTRLGNPTLDVLEQRVALLEGGIGGLAVASGMSAIHYAMTTVAEAGDHIVTSSELYGGTYNLLKHILPRQGIEVTFVNLNDMDALDRAIRPNTKAIFVESISNPSGRVADLSTMATIAQKHGVLLMVDNTVASPVLVKPIELGAHIVVHSATKYIGGHGTTIGGLIIDSGKFDFKHHASRYPQFMAPDLSYHGIVYAEHFGAAAFIARARTVPLRNTGAVLAPLSAFLLLQGLETLSLRIERISDNTKKIVDFLRAHPLVSRVDHVSVSDHPDYELAQKYLPKYQPGILSFEIKGGRAAARAFYNNMEIFLRLVNIGDSKSLITIPADTTHHQLTEEELAAQGINPGLIRLSIGIEHVDDLIADLQNGFDIVSKQGLA